ncbi:MAG: hypothetical protein OEY96_08890 [Gammaproteobacteria bacterium]|nr:hypothetical protein [Gammaproteobacteria bacterium]
MKLDIRKFVGWPSRDCRPIMRLKNEPHELKKKYNLDFSLDKDDLDNFLVSHFYDEIIGFVVLMRHENAPQSGTPVYIDSSVDISEAVERLTLVLNLTPACINWKTEQL